MRLWKHAFRGKALIAAVTAASCQAFLLLGYDQGVVRPFTTILPVLICKALTNFQMSGIIGAQNNFGAYFHNPDAAMQGNITGLYDIGSVIGAIICYFIGEALGRRRMLIAGGLTMIIGTAILASSTTIAQLIVGRMVTGLGNGFNSATAPVYLTECAPASYRGALLTLQGTVTILGVVIAYWLDYGTSFSITTLQWRLPFAFQAVFAIFLVLQIIGLPETPRWLVQHDRYEEAHEVVANIEGVTSDDEKVVQTIQDIKTAIDEEQRGGPFRFKELFSFGETQTFRRLLITISVQLFQQFSGSNFLNYYLPVILQTQLDLDRNMSLILGGAAQCTYLVGSAIPVLLMDRFGRRVLLMVCSAGLSLCFIVVAILLSTGAAGPAKGATAFIFLFQLFYGIGMHHSSLSYGAVETNDSDRLASSPLVLPQRDKHHSHSHADGRDRRCSKLVFGVRSSQADPHRRAEHRLENLHRLRRAELRVHTGRVLLLPRDQGY